MKGLHRGSLVRVEWVDSAGSQGWHFLDDVPDHPLRIVSVGYVVEHKRDRLTITTSWYSKRRRPYRVLDPFVIPAVAIRKVKILDR